MTDQVDIDWMKRALALAQQAADLGEVPVGALVVLDGQVIGTGFNQPIGAHDPCAHAEIIALREAALRLGNYRLPGAQLYVTLEPCMMCAGAMIHARIERLIFAATEPKAGAIVSQLNSFELAHVNHRPAVTSGVLAAECSAQLSGFFRARRAAKRGS
ncbi:tRNA adenosine(34) deaminase TadA [Nitrincola sp. A-D6]|uniref:tRNA adenosine(34) deaminase TadA n=1 Tax=Nitrincola sp. A-D6 TaxID=1545442 RepID=UPI001F25FC21